MQSRTLLCIFVLAAQTLCAAKLFAILKPGKNQLLATVMNSPEHVLGSPKGQFIAYVDSLDQKLKVLDLHKKKVFHVLSKAEMGVSYFWAPDGKRLIIRQSLQKTLNKNQVVTYLLVYDAHLHKKIDLESLDARTGFLTFDPADLRFRTLAEKGIISRQLSYPGKRLAIWQRKKLGGLGYWLAGKNGVVWGENDGRFLKRMDDDQGEVLSFDISPDGRSIVWATSAHRVYASDAGQEPYFIGRGRDPKWHPKKPGVVYSGARMVGSKVFGFDLKYREANGRKVWLTNTQNYNERWPQFFSKDHRILYTFENTNTFWLLGQRL